MYPKLCIDCKWSSPENNSYHFLDCTNPEVNAKNPYSLGSGERGAGRSSTTSERQPGWLKACGIKGKLWEFKVV